MPNPQEAPPIHPMCVHHGEAIAGIKATVEGIDSKLDTLVDRVGIQNGRVAKSEDAIAALAVKQAAHDVIQTQIMRTLMPLEESMGKMKDWRATVQGGAASTAKLIRDWAMLAGLVLALWQGWVQREALKLQIEQVRQEQARAAQK